MERITNWGNTAIKELNAAPDPIETKRAGNAQQIIVPLLVNKDK